MTAGILFTLTAAGLVIAGSSIGPDTSSGANWAEKNRNSLTLAGGGLIWCSRPRCCCCGARRLSAASADAGKAIAEIRDDDRLTKCLDIRAVSIKARDEIATAAQNKANDVGKQVDDLKADLAKAQADAKTAAEKAKTASDAAALATDDEKKKAAAQETAAIAKDLNVQFQLKQLEYKRLQQSLKEE